MIDKEAVRNAALDEAIRACQKLADNPCLESCCAIGYELAADEIKYLKYQPAQPSDTELLRDAITAILWLYRRVPEVYKDMSHIRDTVARLEAAMQADREGS